MIVPCERASSLLPGGKRLRRPKAACALRRRRGGMGHAHGPWLEILVRLSPETSLSHGCFVPVSLA